jgi:hypothetical protein
MSCSLRPQRALPPSFAARHPLRYGISVATRLKGGNPKNWVPPFVYGEILSKRLDVARVVVRWNGGTHRLVLHFRYFVARLWRLCRALTHASDVASEDLKAAYHVVLAVAFVAVALTPHEAAANTIWIFGTRPVLSAVQALGVREVRSLLPGFDRTSRATGLTCVNPAKHGWWLGRSEGTRIF